MPRKIYPQRSLVRIRTSTVLGCSACRGEIPMYEACWEEEGTGNYYHDICKPSVTTETREGGTETEDNES